MQSGYKPEDDNTSSSYRSPEHGSSFVRLFQTHLVRFLCLCGTEEEQRRSKDEFQEQRNRDFGPFWSDGLVMVRYKTAPDAPGPSFPPFGLLRHKLSCFWGAQMATSLVHQRIISVSSDASQALYESQPNCQWTPYADFSNLDNVAVVPLFVQKPNNKETNRLVFFSPPWLASEMVI